MTSLVLVVDDVADNREMYAEYLRYVGLRVELASSAEEALEKAKQETPDIVVMDLALPGMDGWEATRRMKEMLPRTFVVAVSGHALAEHERTALEAGADSFHRKPLLPVELLGALSVFLPASVRDDLARRRRRRT